MYWMYRLQLRNSKYALDASSLAFCPSHWSSFGNGKLYFPDTSLNGATTSRGMNNLRSIAVGTNVGGVFDGSS